MRETYLDCDDAWLKALTRERRLQRAAGEVPTHVCIRVSGESVEFTATVSDSPPARSKSRAKAWRVRQWQMGNRSCFYCTVTMTPNSKKALPVATTVTVDHRQPLGREGLDHPVNYAMCCWRCNNQKGSMTEAEFRAVISSSWPVPVPTADSPERISQPLPAVAAGAR